MSSLSWYLPPCPPATALEIAEANADDVPLTLPPKNRE